MISNDYTIWKVYYRDVSGNSRSEFYEVRREASLRLIALQARPRLYQAPKLRKTTVFEILEKT